MEEEVLAEVVTDIKVTKEKVRIAERNGDNAERIGDISSRDFYRNYLLELKKELVELLRKENNLRFQQQIQQVPATQPGNYPSCEFHLAISIALPVSVHFSRLQYSYYGL